jgi:hypothetical protein
MHVLTTTIFMIELLVLKIMVNKFERMDGEIEVISVKACENVLYNNEFVDCEGTLTLRHGDRNIVRLNKFDGNKKSNSGGIRIIGEDHIVENNIMKNLNGNGTMRCGISLNCGVKNSALNRYFQVLNAKVSNNVMYNCKDGMAIGVEKKEANLKPKNCVFKNNKIINCTNAFSKNNDVKGAIDSHFENNIVNGNLGKSISDVGIIVTGELLLYNETGIGVIESVGIQREIKESIDIELLYNKLKTIDEEIILPEPTINPGEQFDIIEPEPVPEPEVIVVVPTEEDTIIIEEQEPQPVNEIISSSIIDRGEEYVYYLLHLDKVKRSEWKKETQKVRNDLEDLRDKLTGDLRKQFEELKDRLSALVQTYNIENIVSNM